MEKIQIDWTTLDLKNSMIFKALFDMLFPRLYTFAKQILQDDMVSDDIVQDAFLYVWQKDEIFTSFNSFKSYMYACVRNKCMNVLRSQKRNVDNKVLETLVSDEVSVDNMIIAQELKSRILEEINKLDGVKRDMMLLRLDGSSYDEISEELHLNINTLKCHRKQAYKNLRVLLKDEDKNAM